MDIDKSNEVEKIAAVMVMADESLCPDDHTELQRILTTLCLTRSIPIVDAVFRNDHNDEE